MLTLEKLEQAVRTKLRFRFMTVNNASGVASVEDLWDFHLSDLDVLYKKLNVQLKSTQEDSLLDTPTKEDSVLQLKVDIIKHVVKTMLEEQKVKEDNVKAKAKRDRILDIIADKQDEELLDLSVDELKGML